MTTDHLPYQRYSSRMPGGHLPMDMGPLEIEPPFENNLRALSQRGCTNMYKARHCTLTSESRHFRLPSLTWPKQKSNSCSEAEEGP